MKRKPSTEATAAWIRLMRVQSRVLDAVAQDLKRKLEKGGRGRERKTRGGGARGRDPPEGGPGRGAGRRRAGIEEGQLPAAGLVRCVARTVARPIGRDAPCGAGKANADPAILDLAADRPAGGRGTGSAPRVQDRQARPVRRDYRGRARAAEKDVERVFRRDREARRLETVRCGCAKTLRSARPVGLLVR